MLNEATAIARKGEGEWLVLSQTLRGKYRVMKGADGFICNCPDYELRGQTCKHGFAVEFVLRRETKPDGTVIETRAARVTYSQNWPACNAAQTSEKEQFCRKFGEILRSKTPTAQRNELLLKVLCHNIVCVIHEMHESGATPMFPALAGCTETLVAAQQLPGFGE